MPAPTKAKTIHHTPFHNHQTQHSRHTLVLHFTPSDDWVGFGKHRFNFNPFNRICGQLGLDHPVDQKVLLFGC
jgi:hypothetical protein